MSIKKQIIDTNGSIITAAAKLGISRQHLNDICIGRANPSRKLAIKIEEITGIPIAVFGYAKIEKAMLGVVYHDRQRKNNNQ